MVHISECVWGECTYCRVMWNDLCVCVFIVYSCTLMYVCWLYSISVYCCFTLLLSWNICQIYRDHQAPFLPRDAMLARYMLPSYVRLSVTSRLCTKMAKRRIMQTTPYDSPGSLVFWRQRSRQNSDGVTHNGGAKQRWGSVKSAIFNQYLAISQKRCNIGTYLLWNAMVSAHHNLSGSRDLTTPISARVCHRGLSLATVNVPSKLEVHTLMEWFG